MATTFNHAETYVVIKCGNCQVSFALTKSWHKSLTTTGGWFYCPAGHRICYSDTEEQRLRKALAAKQAKLDGAEWERDEARRRANSAERSAASYRGHFNRVRRRVGKGVCPCCHRTFKQLARHMKAKHPEYGSDEA